MKTRSELAGLLEEWRQLTQTEAKAIVSAAWSSVREIQTVKGRLRESITKIKEKWEAENSGEWLSIPGMEAFRQEAARLISLETRNGELVATQMKRAQLRRESLDQALRNLRNVRRSYSRKLETVWNCYS